MQVEFFEVAGKGNLILSARDEAGQVRWFTKPAGDGWFIYDGRKLDADKGPAGCPPVVFAATLAEAKAWIVERIHET